MRWARSFQFDVAKSGLNIATQGPAQHRFHELVRNIASIAAIGRTLALAGLMLLTAGQASAQFANQSSGTFGALLNQLQTLQDSGALGEFGGGQVPSRVDQLRDDPSEANNGLSVSQTEIAIKGEQQKDISQALFVARRFCRGELTENQAATILAAIEFSSFERDYCIRAGDLLVLQGYDFVAPLPGDQGLSLGAISDDYVMGIGDQLVLTFVGQDNRVLTTSVDSEGRIVLPGWQPVMAAGRTFAEVRREIEVRTAISKLGTEVFVSVGNVRSISVTVLGEVRRPGSYQFTTLSTIVSALAKAGIKKSGSLRRIRVTRGNQWFWIDGYDLIYNGAVDRDIKLRDGDQISVPKRGPTFAISGEAQKPGIYEMPEGQDSVTVAEALDISGGTLRPRGNRFLHYTIDNEGHERVSEHQNLAARIREGDILTVALNRSIQVDSVYLDGHVRVPGNRSLRTTSTVAQLLGNVENLGKDPYLLFGALETSDPNTQFRRLFPLNLLNIMTGAEDYALRDGDRLIVLSSDDVRYLASTMVQNIIGRRATIAGREAAGPDAASSGSTSDGENQVDSAIKAAGLSRDDLRRVLGQDSSTSSVEGNDVSAQTESGRLPSTLSPACAGLKRLAGVLSATAVARYANAVRRFDSDKQLQELNTQECPAIYEDYPDLLPLALEHLVTANGSVRRPGVYPVAGNVTLASLVAATGGLSREVDLTRVEISRAITDPVQGVADSSRGFVDVAKLGADKVVIGPGDAIRFNAIFLDRDSGPVYLAGEFIRPGYYDIRRGERLSELMVRAGGLTEQAYPYGAIFTREPVKRIQQIGFQRAARELTSAIAVAAVQNEVDIAGLLQFQQFARQLDSVEALGRVVIEADPTVLQVRPELDVVLQPGDRLYMPKRPNFVVVIGDVLNPGAMQFISGNNADTYIRQAGGLQYSADEDRIFVVYPNGAAEPLGITAWNFNPVQIPPGSTIVVPKDPAPLDLLTVLREGAQVLGQLAVTAASLAVISRD